MAHTFAHSQTALGQGLRSCQLCGFLNHAIATDIVQCIRCGSTLTARRRNALAIATAYTVTAALLYVPANVYPIMETGGIAGNQEHTILGGIAELWEGGGKPLALLVFFASIVVPVAKIAALALLIGSTRFHSTWQVLERARLYRIVDFIGRWSMLDIYVVTMIAALLQGNSLASASPGVGAVAFAGVVVSTLLAVEAFDTRVMWDSARAQQQ